MIRNPLKNLFRRKSAKDPADEEAKPKFKSRPDDKAVANETSASQLRRMERNIASLAQQITEMRKTEAKR